MTIKVDYINHMGDDITVVNSARVSFDKQSSFVDGQILPSDIRLIEYLAKHNHFTPFTHPQVTLLETVPIFVARQRFKHMVGFTYNEVSRRYVDASPEFYSPEVWRSRPDKSIKQGSRDVPVDLITVDAIQDTPTSHYTDFINSAVSLYESMVEDGIAPEQARMVLPQSMLTSYYVTGSLAAFARLYNQRSDPHAQKEIRDLADAVDKIIAPLYPVSWAALTRADY